MTDSIIIWRVTTRVPSEARLAVEEMLEFQCVAVNSFEAKDGCDWIIDGFAIVEPSYQALKLKLSEILYNCKCDQNIVLEIELVAEQDWLGENLASFPPLWVGRYFIFNSHLGIRPPVGSVSLNIDPGTAFGSGEHATTKGCLIELDKLAKSHQFRRPLDMGCGSGILALAMALTWRVPVVALDIDPEAVRVTQMNAIKNKQGNLIRVFNGTRYGFLRENVTHSYDLIVANILARPLMTMSGLLCRLLRTSQLGGGTLILSGFLERDIRWVIAPYMSRGLRLKKVNICKGWATLVLAR